MQECGEWRVESGAAVSACADGLECGSFVNDPYKRRSHFPSFVGAIHESPANFNRAKRTLSLLSTLHVPLFYLSLDNLVNQRII